MFLSIKTINEINNPVLLKQHVLNALTSEHDIDVSAQVNNKKVLKKQHKDPTIHCGDLWEDDSCCCQQNGRSF